MNEKILKNKKVWVAAVIVLTVLVGILFHLNLKKKSYALQALSKASNLTLTQLTPKWTKYLPAFAIEYLKPTFPVSATFSLEEAVSIIEDPEEKEKKAIPLNEASRLLNDLGNVVTFSADCSRHPEVGSVEIIDPILRISSLKELKIIGNRLIIREEHDLSRLTQFTVECSDISESIFFMLSECTKLEVLQIRSKAFMTAKNLVHLKGLTRLKTLELDSIKCAEESLSFLKNMKRLETLNLSSYKEQIINSWGEGGIKLPGGFKIDKSLSFLTNCKKLNKVGAIIELNRENLQILNSAKLYPTAYYRFPQKLDDKLLASLGQFLSNFKADKDFVVKGMMNYLNLEGQKGVTDASIPFLAKFKPALLDLRGTSITKLRDLPLDTCSSFWLPANSNISEAVPAITAKDYDLIDIRGSKITDFELAKIFKQSRPKVFYMDGNNLTEKTIDNAMVYFNEKPKAISKISLGDWDIPEKRRLEFLDRVHQWGMSVVYSSHLTPDLILQNWHLHKTKTVDHDRVGNLVEMEKIFPSLKTLVLRGLPLSQKEWAGFHKLKDFDSLYLESPQNGQAINESRILEKIENFDIKNSMLNPLQLTNNIRKCRVFLKDGEPLKNLIDLSEGSPENLVIDGHGEINLEIFSKAKNLKSLTIGPDVKVTGIMHNLEKLESFKCLSIMDHESLDSISNLSEVKILLINCELLNAQIFSGWKSLGKLEVLDLSAAPLTNSDLTVVNNFPKLRVLNLPAHQGISKEVINILEKNKDLYKLNVIGTSIYPEDMGDRYSLPGHWDYEL